MSEMIDRIFDRKYRITRLIGQGGMATVYEAEHTVLKRLVAVKVMHPEVAEVPSATDRFFREAQSASAIGHPNIIEILHVGKEEDGTVYMVEELLKGQSLKQIMEKESRVPPKTAVIIVLQILSGLKAAHDMGIVHRDIKPDNVFLAKDNRNRTEVKLLDFGVAKIQESTAEMDQTLTQAGTVLGTPKYMSPEQARGADIDQRTDIWSVGTILYEMLCGKAPYAGENYNVLLAAILMDKPKPLGELAPTLPPGLIAVVEKAMTKDRNERYQDAGEMIEDLIPFGKDVDKQMTASTAKALRNSLIPAPAAPKKTTTEKAKDSAQKDKAEYTPVKLKSFPPAPHAVKPPPPPVSVASPPPPVPAQPMPPVSASSFSEGKIDLQYVPALNHPAVARSVERRGFRGVPETRRAMRLSADSRGSGLKWLLGGLVVVVGLAGAIFFFPTTDLPGVRKINPVVEEARGFLRGASPPSPQRSNASRSNEPSGRKDSSAKTAGQEDSKAAEAAGSDTGGEAAQQPKVKIDFLGIPVFASIRLDGVQVTRPITIPKSNESVRVLILAEGFLPLDFSIVPNRDQEMELTMRKINKSVPLMRE